MTTSLAASLTRLRAYLAARADRDDDSFVWNADDVTLGDLRALAESATTFAWLAESTVLKFPAYASDDAGHYTTDANRAMKFASRKECLKWCAQNDRTGCGNHYTPVEHAFAIPAATSASPAAAPAPDVEHCRYGGEPICDREDIIELPAGRPDPRGVTCPACLALLGDPPPPPAVEDDDALVRALAPGGRCVGGLPAAPPPRAPVVPKVGDRVRVVTRGDLLGTVEEMGAGFARVTDSRGNRFSLRASDLEVIDDAAPAEGATCGDCRHEARDHHEHANDGEEDFYCGRGLCKCKGWKPAPSPAPDAGRPTIRMRVTRLHHSRGSVADVGARLEALIDVLDEGTNA